MEVQILSSVPGHAWQSPLNGAAITTHAEGCGIKSHCKQQVPWANWLGHLPVTEGIMPVRIRSGPPAWPGSRVGFAGGL